MTNWKLAFYWKLPIQLQELGLSFYARKLEKLYYGKDYELWLNRLKDWKSWPSQKIENWQNRQLVHIIHTAATKVPFYKKHWNGIHWQKIQTPGDLQKLPMINKNHIRQAQNRLLSNDLNPKSLWVEKTSGSTGSPINVYWPMDMLPKWWAIVEVMIRYEAGVSQQMPRAMVGGRPIVPGNIKHPPYWQWNRRWNQLYLSSYHISPHTTPDYINALRKYSPQWITGYGSSIAALAKNALEKGLPHFPVKAAIVSGDMLFESMRKDIETFFETKCYDSYGQCEGVSMAMECSQARLHLLPFAGITEILCEDGSPCRTSQVGEMVVTTLLNDAMPLIRYRTGDYAAWADDQKCLCGNPNPIITNLEGRVDDFLVSDDGRKISHISTAMKQNGAIHSSQFLQDKPGHAFVLIQPRKESGNLNIKKLKKELLSRVGHFDFEFFEVPEIPKTPQGKTKLVVRLYESKVLHPVYKKYLGDVRAKY